jgi:ariadne-1
LIVALRFEDDSSIHSSFIRNFYFSSFFTQQTATSNNNNSNSNRPHGVVDAQFIFILHNKAIMDKNNSTNNNNDTTVSTSMTNNSVDMSCCCQNNGNDDDDDDDDYESDYEYNDNDDNNDSDDDDADNNSIHDDDEGSTAALSNSITHDADDSDVVNNDDAKQHNNSSKMSSDNDNDCDVDDNEEEEEEYEYNYSDDDDGDGDGDDDDADMKEEPSTSSTIASSSSTNSATATAAATAALSSTSLSSPATIAIAIAMKKKKINKRKQPSSSAKIDLVPAEDLLPKMNHRIQEVHEALGVPLEASSPLLRIHGWSVQSLLQNYLDNPEKLLKEAGVFQRCSSQVVEQDPANTIKKTVVHSSRRTRSAAMKASEIVTSSRECSICMDDIDVEGDNNNNNNNSSSSSLKMNCGHEFCLDCWEDYITNAIEYEGATCILATCPEATCSEVITEKEISYIVSNASSNNSNSNQDENDEGLSLITKFQQYQLRSFVDSNDLARWCPGKGCNRVAHLTCINPGFKFGRHNNNEPALQFVRECIECNTNDNNPNPNSGFCLPCGEEQHFPSTCHQISKWNDKNSSDSETANWITVNTKTCPKCHTRISKNGGCMYMTCRNCRHGFCWICMGTHHVMSCNAFKEGDADDDTNRAKNELERYLHHHERYKGHDEAQKYVIQQIIKLIELEKVSEPTTVSSAIAAAVGTSPKSYPTSSPTKKPAATTTAATTTTTTTTTTMGDGDDIRIEGDSIVASPATPKELFDIRVKLKQANEQLLICRRVLKFT